MYRELILRPAGLSGRHIAPDEARRLLSEALGNAPIDPLIFNKDSQGRNLQARFGDDREGQGWGAAPAIAFDGGLGFLRLYGFGQNGCDVLATASPALMMALSNLHGPTAVSLSDGDVGIQYAGHGVLHRIRRLIVAKKPGNRVAGPVTDSGVIAAIRRQIIGGLSTQAHLCAPAALGSLPLDDDIDVLDGQPIPIAVRPGIFVSAYKNVVISMPVRLRGPWLAGHLRSVGYGYVRPIDPTKTRKDS